MAHEVIIKQEAHNDISEAYNYYEDKQQGLGERFLNALIKRFDDLSQHPKHYSYIIEDPLQVLRDVRLEKFPYLVIFEIIDMNVIIYAVHNTYKNPSKKIRRP